MTPLASCPATLTSTNQCTANTGGGGGGGGTSGSQTYSTSGNSTFIVPSYGTLTVTVDGAGGGGAGENLYNGHIFSFGSSGGSGGSSSFGSLVATGGGGGGTSTYGPTPGPAGANGGPQSGAGGAGGSAPFNDGDPTGGSAGGNGSVSITWTAPSGNPGNPGNPGTLICQPDGNLLDSCGNVTQCVNGCSTLTNTCNLCPAGQFSENGSCVSSCGTGFTQQGNQCVPNSCPTGEFSQNGSCVGSCSPGYIQQGNSCTFKSCPNGYSENGNGQCVLFTPQAPQGDITAVPSIIKTGSTSQVSWSAQDVSSCSVSGTNGDGSGWSCSSQSSCAATSTAQSSAITAQTTYTLSCQGLDNSTFTRSATVNIVPAFKEQ